MQQQFGSYREAPRVICNFPIIFDNLDWLANQTAVCIMQKNQISNVRTPSELHQNHLLQQHQIAQFLLQTLLPI